MKMRIGQAHDEGMIEMSSSEAVNETFKRDGVSLRTIHFWLIVGSVMLCGLMFYPRAKR